MGENEYLLKMDCVTKRFPGVVALEDVSLNVRKGSVHALLGENGAGKSTLMKCLIGLYIADEGVVAFKGRAISCGKVSESLKSGISMIHQEMSAVPDTTVTENIFLGKEITSFGPVVNDRAMIEETAKLLERLEININPGEKVINLSTANKQLVEIAKAVSYNADLIIMDEPTSALTENEVKHLFKIIRSLQAKGCSIIYITHKLEEIFEICDEFTVLRDGKFVCNGLIKDHTNDSLVALMVGRNIENYFVKDNHVQDDVILEAKNLTIDGLYEDINFTVHRGEILGLSGLLGSMRTEIVETLFGLRRPTSGEIVYKGRKLPYRHKPMDAIRKGIGLVTEDRKLSGLFMDLSLKDNMGMPNLYRYTKFSVVDDRSLLEDTKTQMQRLSTKATGPGQLVLDLSGGNQQKVLISRWLMQRLEFLLLDEPTKGIDVGAKSEIYRLMNELSGQGMAIIMVSSEMPELLAMSDNIVVIHMGKQMGIVPREEATETKLLSMALINEDTETDAVSVA
jgi:inositol transport system ATP-binding protein